jgi:hypothetical protein
MPDPVAFTVCLSIAVALSGVLSYRAGYNAGRKAWDDKFKAARALFSELAACLSLSTSDPKGPKP